MLQNMWQELVEAVDDRSAKGIALALSAGIDRGVAAARRTPPPDPPGGPRPPGRSCHHQRRLVAAGPGGARSRPTVVAARGSARPRSGRAATGGRWTRRPASGSTCRPALPDPRLLPDLHAAMQRVPRDEHRALLPRGARLPALRDGAARTWPNAVEALTVVDGAMDAHSQFVAAHLRFGDRVAVEQPCFPPLLDLLEMAGAVPMGVGYDAEGPRRRGRRRPLWTPARRCCSSSRGGRTRRDSRCLAGPGRGAGGRAGGPRRGRRRGRLGRRYADRAPVSLGRLPAGAAPCYVRSFSKTHGPDLRLAAIGGPATVVGPIVERRYLGQGWSSRLVQSILLDLLTDARSRALVATRRRRTPRARPPWRTRWRARGRRTGARRHQRLGAGGGTGRRATPPRGRRHPGRERRPVLDLPPGSDHIRITTSSIDGDYQPTSPTSRTAIWPTADLADLADLVAHAARAGTWSGHR